MTPRCALSGPQANLLTQFPALFGLVCDETSSEIGKNPQLPTNTESF
jgi:hypothetical protein